MAAAYDVVAVDNNIVGEGVGTCIDADVPDSHIVEEGVGSYIAGRVPEVDNSNVMEVDNCIVLAVAEQHSHSQQNWEVVLGQHLQFVECSSVVVPPSWQ